MPPDYWDADWLERKYHDEGLTQREIAEECGVVPSTIRRRMKRYGIETREVKGENHGLYGKERSEEVKERISEKLTGREFSEETREKLSKSLTGKTIPPAVREKISESLHGVSKPDQIRKRMRESKLHPIPKERLKNGWGRVGYGRGFASARTTVHKRDEVCQVCGEDGSGSTLVFHHIVPVRLIVQSPELRFRDAHHPGNLFLVCRACHPEVEWGGIDIQPDFEDIPTEQHDLFRFLWETYIEAKHGNERTSATEE